MVKLNKIYTRTGDDGSTGLASGERVPKWSLRVSAYGAVDETNAAIGMARLYSADDKILDAMLQRIQNDLFDLGADLATPDRGEKLEWEPLRIIASQVTWLEEQIDNMNADIPPLDSFVLPAGSPLASHLHMARTIARHAERLMAELSDAADETVSTEALAYANRLSDFLFVAARRANENGNLDVKWVPGKNR